MIDTAIAHCCCILNSVLTKTLKSLKKKKKTPDVLMLKRLLIYACVVSLGCQVRDLHLCL